MSETATLGAGCFWCVEAIFQSLKGVDTVVSGYAGGTLDSPTYQQVCSGNTGHAEAIEIHFDPQVVSFESLARLFFETHDPTQLNRQGPDTGEQYRSAVFYLDDEQKAVAEQLVQLLRDKGLDVVTEITPAGTFYPAEDYHQGYYANNGKLPYCHAYQQRF